jgi:hypothetical protein
MMDSQNDAYLAYLLRLWRVRETCDKWRVSLEDARTRELHGFASLEEVFAFLQKEVVGKDDEEQVDKLALSE